MDKHLYFENINFSLPYYLFYLLTSFTLICCVCNN